MDRYIKKGQRLQKESLMFRKLWRLWAKSLGEKAGVNREEADRIACIRTVIVLTYIITNIFIIAGVIRHW
jgi:hypothetical protein